MLNHRLLHHRQRASVVGHGLITDMARCLAHEHPRQPGRNARPRANVRNRRHGWILRILEFDNISVIFADLHHLTRAFARPFVGVQGIGIVQIDIALRDDKAARGFAPVQQQWFAI